MNIKKLSLLLILALFSGCFISLSQVQATNPLDSGLLAYYKFDENTGSVAYDSSGFNNNGDLMGSTIWVPGKFGSAVYMDGIGDYIDIATKVIPDLSSNCSVSLWFKLAYPVAPGDRKELFETVGNYSIDCEVGPTGVLRAFSSNYTLGDCSFQSYVSPTLNTWYHVVVVRQEGTGYRIYVNGALANLGSTAWGMMSLSSGFHIGTYRTADSRWWNGTVDDFRIYSRVLSEQEIVQLYAYDPDPTPTPSPTPTPGVSSNTSSYLVFIIPAVAAIFAILAFTLRDPQDPANIKGTVCSFLSGITWLILSGVWTYLFPVLPWLYLSYLWLALGFVFIALGLYFIIDYVSAGLKAKKNQNSMQLRQAEE